MLHKFRGKIGELNKKDRKYWKEHKSPGWIVQLVRALSQYSNAVGLIPGQSMYKNQPVNA